MENPFPFHLANFISALVKFKYAIIGFPMESRDSEIAVEVVGTAPIKRIEVKRDCRTVQLHEPEGESATFAWTDLDFDAGRPCLYYVRIVQIDGEEAISSPVWVN